MCAAYCSSNDDDKEHGNDDRLDSPSRAIPRHLHDDVLANTILQLLVLVGHDLGALAIRNSMLVQRWALWQVGREASAAFVQQI
jgi:hypothetical protein